MFERGTADRDYVEAGQCDGLGFAILDQAPLRLDGSVEWEPATHWHYGSVIFRWLSDETPEGALQYIVTDTMARRRKMFSETDDFHWAVEYRT